MTRAGRRSGILAALLAAALLASACSKTLQFKLGENDSNPVSPGSLTSSGRLNWPIADMPFNYNLNTVDGAQVDGAAVISAFMPSLFRYDARAEPSVSPDFLVSAAVTATTPTQVVTYVINPKAVWSDATPITEADFEAQWKALNGSDNHYKAAFTQGYNHISSVAKGANEREVIVTFQKPFADWRGLFSPLYPASTNRDVKIFNEGWLGHVLTTAGPFNFDGYDAEAKTITLSRNPKWWGEAPRLDSIVFHALGGDPTVELEALRKGTIDFMNVPPDEQLLTSVKKVKDITVRTAGGPDFRQLTMNGASATLGDVTIRKAVALALDRRRMARELVGPLGVPDAVLDNHIYMTNQRGYQANAGDLGTADPKKAGTLLDQAGWKLVAGQRVRNGQPLQIRMVIPDQTATALQEANLVKTMLKDVGVSLEIHAVPGPQFLNNFVARGDYDIAIFSWQGTIFPIAAAQSIYQNPTPNPNGLIIRQNFARVGSQDIDMLFARASAQLDPQEAIRIGNQIDAKIWEEVHSVTLYQRPRIVGVRSRLANFGALGFASVRYEDIGFTKS